MSDKWDNNTIIECARIGVNALVARPFSIDDIMIKIEDALTNGKRKVLIIDDDPGVLNLLRQVVELERFNTITAESAEAGVKVLDETKVDAVISDILLPGMSGVEFMKMNKNSHPNIPIILITGYAGRFDSKAAYEAGADGFFQKPFNNLELIRRLRDVVDKKARITVNS
jgi:DNA-binding NtrC family response regulator